MTAVEQHADQASYVARSEVESLRAELATLLDAARPAAGQTGAQKLSSHYSEQGREAAKRSQVFLAIAAAGIVIAVGMAVDLIWHPLPVDSASPNALLDTVRLAAPRVLILAVVAYLVRFGVRNYAIARHDEASAVQRTKALETFVLLSSSIEDAVARREVMVELVRSVFRPYDTGHLKGNDSVRMDAFPLAAWLRQ